MTLAFITSSGISFMSMKHICHESHLNKYLVCLDDIKFAQLLHVETQNPSDVLVLKTVHEGLPAPRYGRLFWIASGMEIWT